MGGKRLSFFLDANILFSAVHDPESRSAALIALAKQGRCALVSSSYASEEARRNIELKRPQALVRFRQILRWVRLVREAPSDLIRRVALEQDLPAADAPILAAALQARVEYLVTGDRSHFGHLMGQRNPTLPIQVLSLANALGLLLAKGAG